MIQCEMGVIVINSHGCWIIRISDGDSVQPVELAGRLLIDKHLTERQLTKL